MNKLVSPYELEPSGLDIHGPAVCVKTVNHQGTVCSFYEATEGELHYQILNVIQEETDSEESALTPTRQSSSDSTGQSLADQYWTKARPVVYPSEQRVIGMSLLTVKQQDPGANASDGFIWQVLSDEQFIYVFRALQTDATTGFRVYSNRYRLVERPSEDDTGSVPTLILKEESRYRRSKRRETPDSALDTQGARDMDGTWFIEPTMLFAMLTPKDGLFSVTLTPSHIGGRMRWLFFCGSTRSGEDALSAYSFLRSEDGWVEADSFAADSSGNFAPLATFSLLQGANTVSLEGTPDSVLYRGQEELTDPKGKAKKIVTGPRVMFAARSEAPEGDPPETVKRMLTLDFTLNSNGLPKLPSDGTLSIDDIDYVARALSFPGIGSANGSDLEPPLMIEDLQSQYPFTVEFWARIEGDGILAHLTTKKDTPTTLWSISVKNDQIVVAVGDADSTSFDAPTKNQWHHFALTIGPKTTGTGADVNFYVDGKPTIAAWTLSNPYAGAIANMYLGGKERDSANFVKAAVDELRLWTLVRSEAEIETNMYSEFGTEALPSGLIGYWTFNYNVGNDPATFANIATIGSYNATIAGANWIRDTAPVGPADSNYERFDPESQTPGMGRLGYFTSDDNSSTQLMVGADGYIHLYTSKGSNEVGVLHYDTTITRPYFSVQTSGNDKSAIAQGPRLFLAGKFAGTALNRAQIGFTKGKNSLDNDISHNDLTITVPGQGGNNFVEAWANLPNGLTAFADVTGGNASNAAFDPEVRKGNVPFYDYSGKCPVIDLPTDETGYVRLITAPGLTMSDGTQLANGLRLTSANVDTSKPKLKVTLTLSPLSNSNITRSWTKGPTITMAGLPKKAGPFVAAVSGEQQKYNDSWSSNVSWSNIYSNLLEADEGGLLIVSPDHVAITVAVSNIAAGCCQVTVTSGSDSSTLTNVPANTGEFTTVLNGSSPTYNYNTITKVGAGALQNIIAINTGSGGSVKAMSVTTAAPTLDVDTSALFAVIDDSALGKMQGATSAIASYSQGATLQPAGGTAGFDPALLDGSTLFAPTTSLVTPASESYIIAGKSTSPQYALPFQQGNICGWVPAVLAAAGNFTGAASTSISAGTDSANALQLNQSLTIESWVRVERTATTATTLPVFSLQSGDADDCINLNLRSARPKIMAAFYGGVDSENNTKNFILTEDSYYTANGTMSAFSGPYPLAGPLEKPANTTSCSAFFYGTNTLSWLPFERIDSTGDEVALFYLTSDNNLIIRQWNLTHDKVKSCPISVDAMPANSSVTYGFTTGAGSIGILQENTFVAYNFDGTLIPNQTLPLPTDTTGDQVVAACYTAAPNNVLYAFLKPDIATGQQQYIAYNLATAQWSAATDVPSLLSNWQPSVNIGVHSWSAENAFAGGKWAHLAAVASGGRGVKFDQQGYAEISDAEGLTGTKAFSIDGRIEAFAEGCIISRAARAGANPYYALEVEGRSTDTMKRLKLTVLVEVDGATTPFILTGDYHFDPTKAVYFAVECELAGNALQYSFTTRDTGSQASAQTSVLRISTGAYGESSFTTGSGGVAYIGAREVYGDGQVVNGLTGTLGFLRFWDRAIAPDMLKLSADVQVPEGIDPPLANWTLNDEKGPSLKDASGTYEAVLKGLAKRCDTRLSTCVDFYINHERVKSTPSTGVTPTAGGQVILGSAPVNGVNVDLGEFRVWGEARRADQIEALQFARATFVEPTLRAYWPISAGSGGFLVDASGNRNHLKITSQTSFWTYSGSLPPLGIDAPECRNFIQGAKNWWQVEGTSPSAVEYGMVSLDSDGVTRGSMKRAFAYVDKQSLPVQLAGTYVGPLELEYIGQAQTRPTLIGFTEGAPPVPSENLTRPYYVSPFKNQDYLDVTSVTLTEDNNLQRVYSASKDTGFDLASDLAAGFWGKTELSTSFPTVTRITGHEGSIGLAAKFSHSLGFLNAAQVSVGGSNTIGNSVGISGDWQVANPDKNWENTSQKERRYLPDNIGCALVKSSVANVYALRLLSTGSLVSISMVPDPRIEEDYNLIHFPIDPTYTKQGTLDGMIGFKPDNDYPNANQVRGSYFKPLEASNLEAQIAADEDRLRAEYDAFDAGDIGRRQEGVHFEGGDPAVGPKKALSANLQSSYQNWLQAKGSRNLVNTYVWMADGGFFSKSQASSVARSESSGGSYHFSGQAGLAASFKWSGVGIGVYVDANILLGGHIATTTTKQKSEGRNFGLSTTVKTESYLKVWDGTKYSAQNEPGKVDGYRFKSFYLAPKQENFSTFFNTVVDPSWLRGSNSRSAIALRSAQGQTNEIWRLMHRVTYVSRVPPEFSVLPADDLPKKMRTVIDVGANLSFINRVNNKLVSGSAPRSVRIRDAVKAVYGDLGSMIPWWTALYQTRNNPNPEESVVYEELNQDVVNYIIAYFESVS